jgi:hypothetical protein
MVTANISNERPLIERREAGKSEVCGGSEMK